jgi:hypothetical protein
MIPAVAEAALVTWSALIAPEFGLPDLFTLFALASRPGPTGSGSNKLFHPGLLLIGAPDLFYGALWDRPHRRGAAADEGLWRH